MDPKLPRKQFLKFLAAAAGGLGLALWKWLGKPFMEGAAQSGSLEQYLPFLSKGDPSTPSPTATNTPTLEPTSPVQPSPTATASPTPSNTPLPPPTGSRVVHVHDVDATNWDYSDPQYWNYVNQDVVNNMVDQGLMALTGASTVVEAWQTLLPDYQPGQGIAIKVNFNNSTTCDDDDSQIDAIIEPVNAIVRSLLLLGVNENDIWVYDAIRSIPDRFVNSCAYNNIRFFDNGCRQLAGWSSQDPHAYVTFNPPQGIPMPPAIRISDVLINASFLINVPILKRHSFTGWSLGFKHHYGTIDSPWLLHRYSSLNGEYYTPFYNPLVDIFINPHILGKTILTLGDGLFAAFGIGSTPKPWITFDNQLPNSLFLATDPVAIDCVMGDFLSEEMEIDDRADDHLIIANSIGLGVFERGDPWGFGYNLIDYQELDL